MLMSFDQVQFSCRDTEQGNALETINANADAND